jgi:hypothetical protein
MTDRALPNRAETIRQTRRGVMLGDWYEPPRPPGESRRRRAGSERSAPPGDAPATGTRDVGPPVGALERAAPTGAASGGRARPRRTPRVPTLTPDEREEILAAFCVLIEGLYSHLPLKRARYGIDPLQRIRLLRLRSASVPDLDFHYQLASIVTELRDAHTRYIGPAALEGYAAMLPFLVEAYGTPERPRYVVSNVVDDPDLVGDEHFETGVTLRWWNAVPIDLAIERLADQETGGRADSRRARALESLTIRALRYRTPPDEHWVIVGYVDRDGVERSTRFDWRIVSPRAARTAGQSPESGRRPYAIDSAAEVARRVKKLLYAPDVWFDDAQPVGSRSARRARPADDAVATVAAGEWIPTDHRDVVAAKEIRTPSGRFGYLRLWSFDTEDDGAFVAEVVRLLGLLPRRGLVVDLRANPGGLIWAAERLLQLFTPHPVQPTRFSLLATPLTAAMAAAPQNRDELEPWVDSLASAVATGEQYSQAVPITPPAWCNDIGQVYGGPVVAVVDANTYSSGDLFAAGFVDNEIGQLVTIGEATGAGGANVWYPEHVEAALLGTKFEQAPLPKGVGYTLSVRRATRAGAADGTAIEDVGVRGHRTYAMTRRDLTAGNTGLYAFCGRLLHAQRRTDLDVSVAHAGGDVDVVVRAEGLDRIHVFVDQRPVGRWLPIADQPVEIPDLPPGEEVEVLGYDGDILRQRRRVKLA